MPPGPNQAGFAAVNQLPGQSLSVLARKRGMKLIYWGIGLFAVGLLLTIVTAEATSGGIVFYGLMLSGVIVTIRGATTVSRAKKLP
jgi:hypothetical protein